MESNCGSRSFGQQSGIGLDSLARSGVFSSSHDISFSLTVRPAALMQSFFSERREGSKQAARREQEEGGGGDGGAGIKGLMMKKGENEKGKH